MSDTYVLAEDGKTPVAADTLTWGRWFEDSRDKRRVAYTEFPDGIRVSTIFLGLDHSYDGGPPLLWETMIFGGAEDQYQERYTSYDDAVAGHQRAVAKATGGAL